jgi:hypothetical protein
MLWEVEILPIGSEKDYEGQRILASARSQGIAGLKCGEVGEDVSDPGRSDSQRCKSRG